QRIASGYNKMLMTTEEVGAQPKEYTAKYAADRVRNASVIWIAGTMGCAECHNHKYDPFTTKDFYAFEAFFAGGQASAAGRHRQAALPREEHAEKWRSRDEQLSAAKAPSAKQQANLGASQAKWEEPLPSPQVGARPSEIRPVLFAEPKPRNGKQK